MSDTSETVYATSGKYNLKRDLTHTSVKIFDKRKEPKNVEDLAVMLLVDMSGSMSWAGKMDRAKEAATLLAEALKHLQVPCYIMGFAADCEGYEVLHHHFVSWKSNPAEYASIADMSAVAGNNDDGYSLRYAARILDRQNAEHKILFVLSDGMPNCERYRNSTDGVKDAAAAVREAGRRADVFGLGLGDNFNDDIRAMYGGNFLQVRDTSMLAVTLARQLTRMVSHI